MLVSPLCKAPSWSEWLYNKVTPSFSYNQPFSILPGNPNQLMMTTYATVIVKFALLLWDSRPVQGVLASAVLQQGSFRSHYSHLVFLGLIIIVAIHFCLTDVTLQKVRGDAQYPESDIVQACKNVSLLLSVWSFSLSVVTYYTRLKQQQFLHIPSVINQEPVVSYY